MTQPLGASPSSALNLGVQPAGAPAKAAHPVPSGRNLANLRTPKGTNFIRLAFAALFLLGFLGLVGFFLKEHVVGMFPGLVGDLEPDPESVIPQASPTVTVPAPVADTSKGATPESIPVVEPSPLSGQTSRTTNLVGFDPVEPAAPGTQPVMAEAIKEVREASFAPDRSDSPILLQESSSTPPGMVRPAAMPDEPIEGSIASTSQPTAPAVSSPSQSAIKEQAPEEARDAVQALKRFLQASNVSERLTYTLGADVMKPLMERYYSRAADGPVMVDRIDFVRMDPNPELGSGRHCIFSLENKTWEYPVPVMLEEQPDGFKVDWLAFVEFKDRLLEKFFENYQEGAARFHVGIIRHHYFEDNVPNIDRKYAFRVSPAPPNTFQASVFLNKESPLAEQLRTRLPWETHVWAVVELEWKKLGTQQWVELAAIPQMHWYSLPTAPRPISTSQKVPEREMPPGISKNGVGADGAPPALPPGISRSSPDLPTTVKRPLPAGR